MSDSQEVKPIQTFQELELNGKIFLVHKNENGTVIDREELNGEYLMRLLGLILSSDLDHLMLPELLGNSE